MKKSLDSVFFTRLFVSERKQIALMADEKSHTRVSHRLFATSRSEIEVNMKKEFLKYGIELTDKQERLFRKYYDLLFRWNEKINLTAITEYDMVVRKHFIDSALLVKCEKYKQNKVNKVLDLGTGAGFPGIVLAILRPEDSFTLIDSLSKRIEFLKIVISELEITNVQLFHGRAENYGQNLNFRNQYDFVVSRAVAELPLLLEYCIPFVKKDGYFVSYKGPKYEKEIEDSSNALNELDAVMDSVEIFEISEEEKRYLLFVQNTQLTKEKYPRRAGKPKKKPL